MITKWIKNSDELATTENRKMALVIAEAGLSAINTEPFIRISPGTENYLELTNLGSIMNRT